jgi:hypothetical protein
MIPNITIIGLAAALLVACAPVPGQAPSPPPPEVEAPPPPAEPVEARLAPVDVRKMTCATLTSASDDDKAYASTFLLGYRSALTHSHTIEVTQIEAVEDAALADCAARPDALAGKVFADALLKVKGVAEPPPRRQPHRKKVPAKATPAETAPSKSPAMQWMPTQSAPPLLPTDEPPPSEPPGEGSPQ